MAWIQIRLNSTNEKAEQISDFLEENSEDSEMELYNSKYREID